MTATVAEKTLPAWVWPTSKARTLHYFPAPGRASLCSRYFAAMPELFEWPEPGATACMTFCAGCFRRMPALPQLSCEAVE